MERLLQEFEQPVADASGTRYRVYLYGRSRPADTWQGWLVFERLPDGARFATPVETTQPNGEAIVYWATGLSGAYFDGALARALNPGRQTKPSAFPERLVDGGSDAATRQERLADLERSILACFTRHRAVRLPTRRVMDEVPWSSADVVRAVEDLQKQGGLLVRRTEEGNDLLFLTEAGVDAAQLRDVRHSHDEVERQPPKTT